MRLITAVASIAAGVGILSAQNPIVQTKFINDPAPMGHNDQMLLYIRHEDEGAGFFFGQEWG